MKITALSNIYDRKQGLKFLGHRYLPRWGVMMIDVVLCVLALLFTSLILYNTPLSYDSVMPYTLKGLSLIGINMVFFYIYKTYSGIIRHSTFTDIYRLACASLSTAFSLFLISYTYYFLQGEKLFLAASIFLYMFFSFSLLLFFRVSVKQVYQFLKNSSTQGKQKRILIIGVDDQTISLGRAITAEANLDFKLVGFISDKIKSNKITILDRPVFAVDICKEPTAFSALIENHNLEGVLVISDSIGLKEKEQIVDTCLNLGLEVFNIPKLENWNKKEDVQSHIKKIQIEDLLNREPIQIDSKELENDLVGQTIMVTGGAGSIGSEIVRQLAGFNIKRLIIVDNAETALHSFGLFLKENFPLLDFECILTDIRDLERMRVVFEEYSIDIVYHAAAYKHVPMMEKNPHEAVSVNIKGTVNLSDLSVSYGVKKFVMISTDKAVNPTNVMGATKRAAEIYVQSLEKSLSKSNTSFITTRFGNVLGSNGSVIPFFRKQIAKGGPLTVTHKDIIRYFMTISEACQLVLQASSMGRGGEIYIFDMGNPVKILELAERMIRLSGLKPYKDIAIEITGLRPGEKLYEELLTTDSKVLPTYHPKIMISEVTPEDFKSVNLKIQRIFNSLNSSDSDMLVRNLKIMVPEYISENSIYQKLDNHENTPLLRLVNDYS